MHKKVLITRPIEESANLETALIKKGFEVCNMPLMQILVNLDKKYLIEEELNKNIDFAIITSPSGAKAISSLTDKRNFKIVTIGDKTGSILQENGFNNVEIIKKTANELAKYIAYKFSKNSKIIYFAGQYISFDIVQYLQNYGFNAKEITIYNVERCKLSSYLLKKNLSNLTYALFFSKRTAEIFVEEITQNGLELDLLSCTAICLSQNIAQSLNEIKFKNINISDFPTEKSLLKKVI